MINILSSILAFYLNVMPFVAGFLILFFTDGLTVFGSILVAILWPLVILYIAYDMILVSIDFAYRMYNKFNKQN